MYVYKNNFDIYLLSMIKFSVSDNIKLIKILENIYYNPVLPEEFRFLLGRTISSVDLLDMALKDGIIVLYPYHSHLPGFRRLTVQLANFPLQWVIAYRPLAFARISQNSHVNKAFWQQFQIYAPLSLPVIRVAKDQRAMTYVRTMI